MKKIIFTFALSIFSLLSYASPTGNFYINNISSTSGYFSFKIHSEIPNNNYKLEGMPTDTPYLIQRINQFIQDNLSGDNTAYVEFGYSNGIDSTAIWFKKPPCKVQLPNDERVSVIMTKSGARYTCDFS